MRDHIPECIELEHLNNHHPVNFSVGDKTIVPRGDIGFLAKFFNLLVIMAQRS